MKTIVACFFVTLAVAVLGHPQGPAVCVDKDCHQTCIQSTGYSVGFCKKDICKCVPIETSHDVDNNKEQIDNNLRVGPATVTTVLSVVGTIFKAITGNCNVISCVVNCVKDEHTVGACLFGKCHCFKKGSKKQ